MLRVTFTNDGTGKPATDIGHYNVRVQVNFETIWEGRVANHRREDGWEQLVHRLDDILSREWKAEKHGHVASLEEEVCRWKAQATIAMADFKGARSHLCKHHASAGALPSIPPCVACERDAAKARIKDCETELAIKEANINELIYQRRLAEAQLKQAMSRLSLMQNWGYKVQPRWLERPSAWANKARRAYIKGLDKGGRPMVGLRKSGATSPPGEKEKNG